jgi:photosystem II stability/assembly factor-like uncharacterized protein
MDRPQIHWFFKRVKVNSLFMPLYFELAGGLAFLLRRFHFIQPEYKKIPAGTIPGFFPWLLKTAGQLPAAPRVQSFATDGSNLFIGTQASGLWKSANGGTTWTLMPSGVGSSTAMLYAAAHLVNIGPADIVASTDGGLSWYALGFTPDLSEPRSIAYGSGQLYLGTTTTVYWSADFLGGWTAPITPPGTFIQGLAIGAVAGTVYAASAVGGMFKTTDGGQNWAAINVGLLSLDCQCVSFADGVLYCGTNTTGAYKSTDGGATWTQIITGLTDLNVVSIHNSTALIAIAGTQAGGAFLTIDGGATWTAQNTGLTGFAIAGTFAVTIGTHVYAGTDDGFFMTDWISDIGYPLIGVEFTDGVGKIRWQLQPIPALLYSCPRYDGVIVKTETAPFDQTGYGVNMSHVFKPRSNTLNLFYDVGEVITCKLTGFEYIVAAGGYCPDYVDIAIEGVYLPNMPQNKERI